MWTHAVSYQLMLQQSNRTAQRICCHAVSSAFFPLPLTLLFTHQYLYRIHIEHCLLPICMSPFLNEYFLHAAKYCGSSQYAFVSLWLARSSRCRLAEPLSFSGCHAQVNPWSPTLKCIAGGPERAVSVSGLSPLESAEGAWYQGGCT